MSNDLPHPWSESGLILKAKAFASTMHGFGRESYAFGLFGSFLIEILARACLAKISPVLLAATTGSNDWRTIYFALGHTPPGPAFKHKSVSTADVITRVKEIYPEFTAEFQGVALQFLEKRNSELHDGTSAFHGMNAMDHGKMYGTIRVLLEILELKLDDFFEPSGCEYAERVIKASKDETANSVLSIVENHKQSWQSLTDDERNEKRTQAEARSLRMDGHRVECPACKCVGLLQGDPISTSVVSLDDDMIKESFDTMPTSFVCSSCPLQISGYSKLAVVGLGDIYKSTRYYEPRDYFNLMDERDFEYEDYNE